MTKQRLQQLSLVLRAPTTWGGGREGAGRPRGSVLADRYHLRVLKTPREVRNALAYVLLNVRKHWRERYGVPPQVRLDEASSGCWFDGWRGGVVSREPPRDRAVSRPRTWLLSLGWRRHGLIDAGEVPGR